MDVGTLILGIVVAVVGLGIMILGIVLHVRRHRDRGAHKATWPYILIWLLGVVLIVSGSIIAFGAG